MIFEDRQDAGRRLAALLSDYTGQRDVIVLALPRGGVPVAYPVAEALRVPLDIFLVRKLGVPGHEEMAMGAIATGGTRVLNMEVVRHLRIPPEMIDMVAESELRELRRREQAYRGNTPPPDLYGKTVILVDDGLATGASMRAAVIALRQHGPRRVVVAVPVAAEQTCDEFQSDVDQIVCAATPEPFHAVGLWYRDFSQTTDDEVKELLSRARTFSTA
jgi:putative phosphoribosyl transferase